MSILNRMSKRAFIFFLPFVAVLISTTFFVSTAHAAPDLGMFEIGEIINLPEGDLQTVAIRLINVALEFIGILTLCIILWAGFLYMLSGGQEEKTARALGMIKSAIIGLIIILSAWGIVRFVLTSLIQATGNDEVGIHAIQFADADSSLASSYSFPDQP